MAVILVYAGIILVVIGALSAIRPLKILRITNRGPAFRILGLGLFVLGSGAAMPSIEMHGSGNQGSIDRFIPVYQFNEFHETRVRASSSQVFDAMKKVTAGEIRFFRLLTWIRSPRLTRTARETVLSASAGKPILDVALHSGFLLLAEDPNHEIVFGTVLTKTPIPVESPTPQDFLAFRAPGSAKAVMNFRVFDEGGGWCRVTTETRVFAADSSARRKFAVYWRLIYPGSALIRRMWLAAIKRRAEGM